MNAPTPAKSTTAADALERTPAAVASCLSGLLCCPVPAVFVAPAREPERAPAQDVGPREVAAVGLQVTALAADERTVGERAVATVAVDVVSIEGAALAGGHVKRNLAAAQCAAPALTVVAADHDLPSESLTLCHGFPMAHLSDPHARRAQIPLDNGAEVLEDRRGFVSLLRVSSLPREENGGGCYQQSPLPFLPLHAAPPVEHALQLALPVKG